jgi:hypothetical protein
MEQGGEEHVAGDAAERVEMEVQARHQAAVRCTGTT